MQPGPGTYDGASSIGPQVSSAKTSNAAFGFGSGTRQGRSKGAPVALELLELSAPTPHSCCVLARAYWTLELVEHPQCLRTGMLACRAKGTTAHHLTRVWFLTVRRRIPCVVQCTCRLSTSGRWRGCFPLGRVRTRCAARWGGRSVGAIRSLLLCIPTSIHNDLLLRRAHARTSMR